MADSPQAGPPSTALVRRARKIYRELCLLYPNARCELEFRNPFELLVATVLSAQTTDVRVNSVTGQLFAEFPDPYSMSRASLPRLEEILRPLGFFRSKSTAIARLSGQLERDFGGRVPATVAELITLSGVGRKTANVVLGNA
ncbi:MAG: endonuclease III domain-containing protein, partial [Angustibacter sp.]